MSTHESRCDNWDDVEVRMLIEVWGDDKVQSELEHSGRNIHIYRRIATKLARLCGDDRHERDANSCHSKIKSLTQAYKKCRDHNNHSGRDVHTFRYYDALDRLTAAPLNYVDTAVMGSQQEDLTVEGPTEVIVGEDVEGQEVGDVEVEFEVEVETETSSRPPTPLPQAAGGSQTQQPTQQAAHQTTRKRKGVGRNERFMENLMSQFVMGQRESATRFQEMEDKHLKIAVEVEERRHEREMASAQAQREHDERMMRMMMSLHQPPLTD